MANVKRETKVIGEIPGWGWIRGRSQALKGVWFFSFSFIMNYTHSRPQVIVIAGLIHFYYEKLAILVDSLSLSWIFALYVDVDFLKLNTSLGPYFVKYDHEIVQKMKIWNTCFLCMFTAQYDLINFFYLQMLCYFRT